MPLDDPNRPKKILVSLRNEEKSLKLSTDFPSYVEVLESNDEIVSKADIVFIGLLPAVARAILPTLPFNHSKYIISMMAAVNFEELIQLVSLPKDHVIRTVPLPAAARRNGPILSFPHNDILEQILQIIGTPIVFDVEDDMKTIVSITGHISPFFELMRVTQQWAVSNGASEELTRKFISSFYSSLAQAADLSTDSFAELCHEAATPGGLNEQAVNTLRGSRHFKEVEESLSAILSRLKK